MADLDDKLERIQLLLDYARAITEALETGATAETETDVDAAISEAFQHAREMLNNG